MSSGLDDTRPLAEHIGALLLRLKIKAPALQQLWVEHDITLQCVGYFRLAAMGCTSTASKSAKPLNWGSRWIWTFTM